jgi:hypothetical protein
VESSGNVRAPAYHQLLLELITEAERSAHKPQQRLIFMGCLARLLPCISLYVLRHTAALMPLLFEWSHAYDEASVLAAVRLLGSVVRHAWPRVGVHVALIWQHLVEVVRAAEQRQWLEVGRQESDLRHTLVRGAVEGAAIGEAKADCDMPAKDAVNRSEREQESSSSVSVEGFDSSVVVGAVLEVVGLLAQCGADGLAAAVAATSAAELKADGHEVTGSWVGMLVRQARAMQRACV